MGKITLIILLFLSGISWSQRMIPLGSSFKDAIFAPTSQRLIGPSVFPVSETEANVYHILRDSVIRYSEFTHWLYQRQPIEITDSNNVHIWIAPLLDLSYGTELQDTNHRRNQNTRGGRLEGTIGKRIFFTTSFYENQAILPSYVSQYVAQRGEQYYNPADSNYYTANAVIPGSARTKTFKVNGYDYAYATGMLTFYATPKWTIHWGNQSTFVGSGHRSLLWSDNSVGTMNLRMRYRFSKKWDLQFVRARGLNLLRRPVSENGEAYYEPKSLSITTLYFQPTDRISIGLFEGGMWNRGDSVSQRSIPALYFLPLPGTATLQEAIDGQSAYALLGIDFKAGIGKHLLYGQFALNPAKNNSLVYQVGVRIFPLKHPFIQAQIEYNHADKQAYTSSVARLNYSNYNLPIAHPSGSGFDEILVRLAWEKAHWFITAQTNYFITQSENEALLMPVIKSTITSSRQVLNQSVEVGYRFNRSYGFETFAGFRYRFADGATTHYERSWLSIGIRTQLTNHYFDF